MEKDLISVVIPVYQVGKYLNDFLKGIDNQTYKNFELIFVDDGSFDDSPKILDKYCSTHQNACVIHKKNQGVAIARNIGIKKAKGEFLAFLDPDDIIRPRMFEVLIGLIKKYKADMSICSFYNVNEKHHFKKYRSIIKKGRENIYKGNDRVMAEALARIAGWGYPWNKLYRHSTLAKSEFYPDLFPVECAYFDDALFNLRVAKVSNVAVKTNLRLYNYRHRKTGITKKKFSEKKFSIFENVKFMDTLDDKQFPSAQTYKKTAAAMLEFNVLYQVALSDYQNKDYIRHIYKDFSNNLKSYLRAKLLPLYFRLGMPLTGPFIKLLLKLNKKI